MQNHGPGAALATTFVLACAIAACRAPAPVPRDPYADRTESQATMSPGDRLPPPPSTPSELPWLETFFDGLVGDDDTARRVEPEIDASLAEAERRPDPRKTPRLLAYAGCADLLAARRATAPWTKWNRANEGLELLDRAVAAAPDDPEIRFLRGITTRPLPALFKRGEIARRDLELAMEELERARAADRRPGLPERAIPILDENGPR